MAEALADELAGRDEVAGRRFLLLRADIARPLLRQRLIEAGAAEVRDVAIYETRTATEFPAGLIESLLAGKVNWITFSSSSTVRNFVNLMGEANRGALGRIKLASIGPITTSSLREAGLTPTAEAKTFNIDGLIRAIVESK